MAAAVGGCGSNGSNAAPGCMVQFSAVQAAAVLLPSSCDAKVGWKP